MKIGILTYHRSHNYGALLQAIATRVALTNLGHDVFYIDYWPKYHKHKYSFFSYRKLRIYKLEYLKSRLLLFREIHKRLKVFENEIQVYIEPYCTTQTKFDAIIYGSDQIWRKQSELHDYNGIYFANGPYEARYHIAYAASMGKLSYDDGDRIKNLLTNFTSIGVREKDLYDFIVSLGYKCNLNLDPTLLLTSNQWDSILRVKQFLSTPYVLYYSLNEGVFNKKAIEEYAAKKKLSVVEICGNAKKPTKNVLPFVTLSEFVSLIKYADTVFSTSFHGLVFSLLYHKKVFTSNISNTKRQKLLLSSLGLQELFVEPQLNKFPDIQIDFNEVDKKINNMKGFSMTYLTKYVV